MDRRFTFLSFVVLLATGCQQNPYVSSHLEILGAERRALEDRVLDLEFELERAEKRLKDRGDNDSGSSTSRSSRPANRSLRNSGAGNSGEDDGSGFTSPSIVIPGQEDSPLLEPPRVNEGRPVESLPTPPGDSAMRSPRYQKPTRPISAASRGPGDPRITHIALNPTLTGGTDFDRKSGDDGLMVVLEPRNVDNEFVPLAGPITVVLLDYAKRDMGSDALVARWHIDAPNVHKAIVNDDDAQGIQLRLPWPDAAPEHSKLRLDVRYTTADGRHLDARADVYITMPGQFSARWTPRAPRSNSAPDATPSAGQEPVNVARQPDEKESAATTPTTDVIQSSFTTVSRAADIIADDAISPRVAEREEATESVGRPEWQPDR